MTVPLRWEADRSDPRYAGPKTVAFATAALPLGFATAQVTGIRPLGGAVLAALALAAVANSHASRTRKAIWLTLLVSLFIVSHILADPLGTAAAIATVTVAAATAAFYVLAPSS